jgi:hypothetical protein
LDGLYIAADTRRWTYCILHSSFSRQFVPKFSDYVSDIDFP